MMLVLIIGSFFIVIPYISIKLREAINFAI